MADTSKPTIVVIGAGIIGLTSALTVQERLSATHNVLIVAREFPTSTPGAPVSAHDVSYASMWAGAHVRPIPAATPLLARQARWLKTTAAHLRAQRQQEPWIGISAVPGIEYLEAPGPSYRAWTPATFAAETGLEGFRTLPPAERPAGVALGFAYDTFCVNAPLYCTGLLRTFILRGGQTRQRALQSEWEAFSLAPRVALVVNASGSGFGDPKSFPTRGQIAVTNLDVSSTITRQNKDGSWSFVIPRAFAGGTIVGGTKEPGVWDTEARPETRQRLLEAAKSLAPEIAAAIDTADRGTPGAFRVLLDVVGRRPTREGDMRVEAERHGSGRVVVHAYGAGGRGYELSWGIAGDVGALVEGELRRDAKANL